MASVRSAMQASILALSALVACSTLRPGDVPEPPSASAAATNADFPAAAAVLTGCDLSGEHTLRDGDQVLYGFTARNGDRVTRSLLRVQVRRREPAQDVVPCQFNGPDTERRPLRMSRFIDLDVTLFDVDGTERMRSRIERTIDFFFEESFVAGIQARASGDAWPETVASLRLIEIARLLCEDPILAHLLAQAASVPWWDVRLLWRRVVRLDSYFDKGRALGEAVNVAGSSFGGAHELPFDLFLNDSLFVRLSATVVDPQGPLGVTAGIVRLHAQQADDPGRSIALELLAAQRGPRSDFAAHGIAVWLGYSDEGEALAWSPDGRWLATPGPKGVVELRDLQLPDPTVPLQCVGAGAAVGDLLFLDDRTLLVGRGNDVEVFDVQAATVNGDALAPVACIRHDRAVLELEAGPGRSCFVGGPGAAVQWWVFDVGGSAPAVEMVRPATVGRGTLDNGANFEFRLHPPRGFLVADREQPRVVVRREDVDTEHRRAPDGTWQETELAPLAHEFARRDRLRTGLPGSLWDLVAKGIRLARTTAGMHSFADGVVSVTLPDGGGTRVLGRSFAEVDRSCHGFDPTERFFVFVGPGQRLLVDSSRVRTSTAAVDGNGPRPR